MNKDQSLKLASIIFGLIALLHLLRSIFRWQALIENFIVPIYFSYIAFVVAGFLSWWMYRVSKKK